MTFTFTNSYLQDVYENVCKKNAHESELLQAVGEVPESLQPVMEQNQRPVKSDIIDRITEPKRSLLFHISWVDDHSQVQINRGYRVQFSTAIGPSKDGPWFHPSVNLSIIKFLGFEQVLKNSLTGLSTGGGKGGTDSDSGGKSGNEVMHFCQSFMTELQRHIGPDTGVPTGDIGMGAREIGYLFDQYKRVHSEFNGMLAGKGLSYGSSLARAEATGYGLCYFTDGMLRATGRSFQGQNMVISGSDNVAVYANQKAIELGDKAIVISDSSGRIVDESGISYKVIQEVREVRRARIRIYLGYVPTTRYFRGCQGIWTAPCDIALPCAAQGKLPLEGAKALVECDCLAVAEGANMPFTPEAVAWFQEHDVLFAPVKASSVGSVATSGLETDRSSMHLNWSFKEVDQKLHTVMRNIYHNAANAAAEYDMEGSLVTGTNITGFMKVTDAMIWQGMSY